MAHLTFSVAEEQVLHLLRLETAVNSPPIPTALVAGVERLALENELASTIALNLANVYGWAAVPPRWREEYLDWDRVVSSYLAELDRIASILAEYGISLVALKNSGIARAIYVHPGAVPMGDVDVLVKKREFHRAHELLQNEGYVLSCKPPQQYPDIEDSIAAGVAEYEKRLQDGTVLWFEMHWRPITGRWIRPEQEPNTDDFFTDIVRVTGSEIHLLAPVNNLLQVCLHTARHSYVRAPGLRLHLDVARIVNAYPDLDWGVFVTRVQDLQVKTATYFSLLIPAEVLGVPIPAEVLAALRPPPHKERKLRDMIAKAGLFDPQARKFSRQDYVLFNALLYDDWQGLWRGVFPERDWMQRQYQFSSPLLLPYYHTRRLADLLFRRLAT